VSIAPDVDVSCEEVTAFTGQKRSWPWAIHSDPDRAAAPRQYSQPAMSR